MWEILIRREVMEKFFRSRLFGWMLLGMLAIVVWLSDMWRLPFLVEWHLFPTWLFWVELMGVGAEIGMIGIFALIILQSIRRPRHSKTP